MGIEVGGLFIGSNSVKSANIGSGAAASGTLLTADGSGNSSWVAPAAVTLTSQWLYSALNNVNVTGGVAETTLMDASGSGSATLGANYLTVGKNIRITMWMDYVTKNTSETLKVKAGSTVLATFAAIGAQQTSGNRIKVEALITCRTTGAGGTVVCVASLTSPNSVGAQAGTFIADANGVATVSLDTTASQALSITATPGNAADSITSVATLIEALN